MKSFPKKLYVSWEKTDPKYQVLIADELLADVIPLNGKKERVGVYVLKELVTASLESESQYHNGPKIIKVTRPVRRSQKNAVAPNGN